MTQEKTSAKKDAWAVPEADPKYVWMSGRLVEWENAIVHASMLGWSSISMVFEGIRGYWNPEQEQLHIFHLDAHLKRLSQSMKIMKMKSPCDKDELSKSILELVRANELHGDCYIQPLAYFGEGRPGYLAASETAGEITIFARNAGSVLGTGGGVHCGVSSWSRLADNVMPPRAKAISNYQNSRYVGRRIGAERLRLRNNT